MVSCKLQQEKKYNSSKIKEEEYRKLRKITFVVPPCRKCKHLVTCDKGKRMLRRVADIALGHGINSYEEIDNIKPGLYQRLKKAKISELWLHDFNDQELPTSPFRNYYVIEYTDGTRQMVLMMQDDDDEDFGGCVTPTDPDDIAENGPTAPQNQKADITLGGMFQ